VNAAQATQLSVVAVVVSGGLASINAIQQGRKPGLRIGLGVVVAGVLLGIASDFAPQLGGSLAALLLVSSLLAIGGPALGSIQKGLTG
jgi:hypothetical protein